jgi:hypothetical protein
MYAGGVKQVQYKEYICWMKVKIYISDQTSLRICNSVEYRYCRMDGTKKECFCKLGTILHLALLLQWRQGEYYITVSYQMFNNHDFCK